MTPRARTLVTLSMVVCGIGSATAHGAEFAVDEGKYVALGGIEQWVTIRAQRKDAPILLWIHGGPADVQSPLISVYEPWTRDFTFVQWDQRGAGKTFRKNSGAPEDVTLERIAQDGLMLVEHLRKRFGVSKIIVAGHSWGTLVAMTMVEQRPELFEAFIAAGQVSSWRETVRWQYDFAVRRAREAGDNKTLTELETNGPPPHDDMTKYFAMRRKLGAYFPAVDSKWIDQERALYASEPGATADDVKAYSSGGAFSGARLMPTIMQTDLPARVSQIAVRFCVIQGELDTFTPTDLARNFFAKVAAPVKFFAVIPDAGHFAPMTHGEEFLEQVGNCLAQR